MSKKILFLSVALIIGISFFAGAKFSLAADPSIFNVVIGKAETIADINWNSGAADISSILYGTVNSADGINMVAKDSVLTTSHLLRISNLTPGTKYYFKILSNSLTSNLTESQVYDFITDGAEISNVEIKNITTNSAIVEWTSNSPDISSILYGTENSPNGINYVAKDTNMMTQHRLYVQNLATNTKYYFQIQSNFLTNRTIESAVYDFTTSNATYSIGLNPSGMNGTIVSSPAGINCSVVIGTTGYVSGTCVANFSAGTVVTLTASPASGNIFSSWNTWYNSNNGGCTGSSSTCTLTMNKDYVLGAIFDSAGAQAASNILIYDIGASYVAADKFNITWTTNGNYDCTAIYSTKDGNLDDDSLVPTRDPDDIIYGSIFAYTNSGTVYYYKMDNSMGLSNQGDSNKGYYKIICYDQSLPLSDRYNNRAISSVYSIDLIKISNVEVKNITTNSAIVEWTSNSPDISSILYGTENSPNGISYVAKDTNMMTQHRLYVQNLATNTKYYFQIQSNSLTSHAIESTVYNFTTTAVSNNQITQITTNANLLINDKMSEILAELNQLRSIVQEQQTQIKYLSSLLKDVQGISAASQAVLNNFITYGVDANTVKLGAGERAAVINSYKAAFDKLPQTEAELADVIKIANGRWPSLTNQTAENQAKAQFQKIYKRAADMNGANDNAAVTIMAYGLRQKAENRNLNSEVNGIKIFKAIYGHTPKTTEEWNAMQAITYSGATQKTWSGYNPNGN